MTLEVSGEGSPPGTATLTMLGASGAAEAFGWDIVSAAFAKPR